MRCWLTDKGEIVLKDSDKNSTVWSTRTSGKPVVGINLTDTGNLLLFDKNEGIVWQSFDHLTDTLLRGQKLMVGMNLVSGVSDANTTEQSRFSITLTTHGLYAIVGSKAKLSYYFLPSKLSDKSYVTMVNGTFALFLNGSASGEAEKAINTKPSAISPCYIRLDIDGHLRAYGCEDLGWSLVMGDILPLEACRYPTICGPCEICSNGQCTCPLSRDGVIYFNRVSLGQPELGCSPVVPLTCEDSQNQIFLEVKDVTNIYFSIDISGVDANGCRDACAKNCSCKAPFFKHTPNNSYRVCFLPSELFSMINADDVSRMFHNYTVYLEVQNQADNSGFASKIPGRKEKKKFLQKKKGTGLGFTIAFAFFSSAALLLMWRKMRSNEETEDDGVEEVPGMPAIFMYADLKSIMDDQHQGRG